MTGNARTCRHGRNLNVWSCTMRGIEVVHEYRVGVKKRGKRSVNAQKLMNQGGAPTPPARVTKVVGGGLPGSGKNR
jgi:hypothetical protein